jgi:hypothetical protein
MYRAATMILADAQQAAAASETFQLSAARGTAVQLADSPASGSTALVSLWQKDITGLKAERVFGCQKLTSSGVCVTGANYTSDSPGPILFFDVWRDEGRLHCCSGIIECRYAVS